VKNSFCRDVRDASMSRTAAMFCCIALAVVAQCLSIPQAGAQEEVVLTLPGEGETDWSQSAFWETLDGKPNEASWQFADGEVRLVQPRGAQGSLISGPLPPNFELTWQWKVDAKTNTGLKYRVAKFGNQWLGVEYQIIDRGNEDAQATDKGSTASIYDLFATSSETRARPVGHWNESRVVVTVDRIEHYLNEHLVAACDTSGPQWDAAIARSKFYGVADFGQASVGNRIMLTDHGGKAAFKDFQFTPLSDQSTEQIAQSQSEKGSQAPDRPGPFLANGFRNSWANQTSIVLWTRTTRFPEMITNGPQFLSLDKSKVSELAKQRDAKKLLQVQLPEGASLDTMQGACPGKAGEVRLTYFAGKKSTAAISTDWVATVADSDFTAQWKLDDLRPGTSYTAIVEARDPKTSELTAVLRGGFQTAPAIDQATAVTFCMTTCHDYLRRDDGPRGHLIYPAMAAIAPDFVVHAGDIEYYDKPDPWAWTIPLMRFKWARLFSLPSNRHFYQNTTSYFLKDDHDTLANDCWAGQKYGAVTFEEGVRLFNEEQFPSLSPRYTTVRWGRDLQIWFLEGRDFRSPNTMPDGPEKTILGAEQKAWLFQTLADCDATFRVIVSPTPIVGPDREKKRDNHANDVFAHEGNEIRAELAQYENVIVLCGDRHWQYASVDDQTGLWEFGCGPGSERHDLGWKVGDERPSHRFLRVAGGFLSGTVKGAKRPTLTLRHHKVTGETVSEFQFPQ